MLEKVFSILLCIISAVVYYSASNFDMSYIGDSGLGPDFFPKVISVILFILSALIFIFKVMEDKKGEAKENNGQNPKATLLTIGVFAVYIFLIGKIGYLTSTILFSFVVISILKKNSLVLKIVYSIIFPLGLYLLFTYAFKVSLPVGILI
ncbi:MAG: tripartite tricarboxylate transporter TctB family protein [Fusobacterium perfoetens]|uniref:tripartite tricarboxylate transporter TctB family protein n=1 Tax=Fusobacterium perfoetens TaxID=852 RepID=UPI0023F10DA2|nr:tripartite tricarboxylate transporter TctB family protein [Fusobacterium perfoetens]MCI6151763.1 tripartite tricarboxylate transporter TctB family protein [Fusobacterium perfoetens]MDY3236876.1 tripartite tricarboxylate transporter TctB family protein [Fusobacterium perfoetens]